MLDVFTLLLGTIIDQLKSAHFKRDDFLVTRLDHRSYLRNLRPPFERSLLHHLRGYSLPPDQRQVLGSYPKVQGEQVLHGPDRHPSSHEVRGTVLRQVRPLIAQDLGHRG